MEYIILFIIAFCPALFFIFFINAFDFHKPEPPKAILISAILGIIAALAVVWGIDVSSVQIEGGHDFNESLMTGFLRLALPSEIAKWLVLCVFLSLNRFYDEYVDGIVYSVCLSMGYAGVFGAWFLTSYIDESFAALSVRSIITVIVLIPLHVISGTVMGYFLGLARKRSKIRNHALALFLPILIDGILCSMVLMIGPHEWYYFAVGIILTILAMVVFTQIFHLLKLDRGKQI